VSTVIISRGILDGSTAERLRTLPLIEKSHFSISICSRRLPWLGNGSANKMSSHSTNSEGIVRTGNFTNESLHAIAQQQPKIIAISQETGQKGSLARLASDGLCLLNKGRTPVLLLPTPFSAPSSGRVLIAAMCSGIPSVTDGTSIPGLLDLNGREVVVMSIARPFHPPFTRVAMAMRGNQSRALREIWEEQTGEATVQAELIATHLSKCGKKPLFVGRTGRFANEVCQASRSADTSLVCLLMGQRARKWLNKSVLIELLEKANAPILLVP